MNIGVHSEIGRLRRVLVHRPGAEIERMTQHNLELMLFDDILALEETAAEHDVMTQILRDSGATVVYTQALLESALAAAPPAACAEFVTRVCALAGVAEAAAPLLDWAPGQLAEGLIAGVYWRELKTASPSLARIRATLRPGSADAFALNPLPNLMFMRDPCMAVFDRVVVGRMATAARARESLLVSFSLRHAPEHGASVCFDDDGSVRGLSTSNRLEGGDVLVLSPQALMIGCSMRTSAETLERLASEALFEAHPTLQRVLVVFMPEARSVMHLDTILTQVDHDLFLAHRPLILGGPGRDPLAVAEIRRDGPPRVLSATVLDVLRETLSDDVSIAPCGGEDPLHQEREQWTDGANAVAVAPGHIILYSRNARTRLALAERGFSEVLLSTVQSTQERAALIAEGAAWPRTIYSFTGSELSRARGGGRCLTMPLLRDPLRTPGSP